MIVSYYKNTIMPSEDDACILKVEKINCR